MATAAAVTGESSFVDQQSSNQLTNEPLECNIQSQEVESCGGLNTKTDSCMEASEMDQWEGSNSDVQDVLQKLGCLVPSRCLQYARRWTEENHVSPNELLDFVNRLLQHFQAANTTNKANGQPPSSSISPYTSSSKYWFLAEVNICCVVTGQTFGVHDLIMEKVKNKKMTFTRVNVTDQHNCDIIIIFCPVTSRAGSDVEAAMMTPQVATSLKKIILVLMHHTRDKEYSTAGRKCSETFPRVVCEVHLLFHETQSGLLKCSQNHQAISEIITEVYSHGKYR